LADSIPNCRYDLNGRFKDFGIIGVSESAPGSLDSLSAAATGRALASSRGARVFCRTLRGFRFFKGGPRLCEGISAAYRASEKTGPDFVLPKGTAIHRAGDTKNAGIRRPMAGTHGIQEIVYGGTGLAPGKKGRSGSVTNRPAQAGKASDWVGDRRCYTGFSRGRRRAGV